MKRFAFYVSSILNPFIVFSFLPFILVYKATQNGAVALQWSLFTLVFILLVAYFVHNRVKKGIFSDFDISKREQRKTVFIFIAFILILYFGATFLFHAPLIIFLTIVGVFVGLICIALVNMKIKASGHVAVLTTVLVLTVSYFGVLFLPLLLLIPLLGWSRVTLKRHRIQETIVGFMIGIFLVIVFTFLSWITDAITF